MQHLGKALITAIVIASSASAELVTPPALSDKELISSALSLCVAPQAKSRSEFIRAAQANGFNVVGRSSVFKLLSLENDERVIGSLRISALDRKPGIFDCSVSSSASHRNSLRRSLQATLKANYPNVQYFPLNNGWLFHQKRQEYVASISKNPTLGTTAITISFISINK